MIHTDDLYLGALGLLRGGELAAVEVRSVLGRKTAFFRIEGGELGQVEREYHRGPTLVDLRLFKHAVRRLKDAAFGALRAEESTDAGSFRDRGVGSFAAADAEPAGSRRR